MNIWIRNQTAADAPAIKAVTISALLNAPHASHTGQFIVTALRKAGLLSISLVADAEGTAIGHAAVCPVSISRARTVITESPGGFGVSPHLNGGPRPPCRARFTMQGYVLFPFRDGGTHTKMNGLSSFR
jgi:predicted N-acetyltransferase YhbS